MLSCVLPCYVLYIQRSWNKGQHVVFIVRHRKRHWEDGDHSLETRKLTLSSNMRQHSLFLSYCELQYLPIFFNTVLYNSHTYCMWSTDREVILTLNHHWICRLFNYGYCFDSHGYNNSTSFIISLAKCFMSTGLLGSWNAYLAGGWK